MDHSERWCPVVDLEVPPEDRVRHQPCPFCGTPIPKQYERSKITDEARAKGAAWKADHEESGGTPASPPIPGAVSTPEAIFDPDLLEIHTREVEVDPDPLGTPAPKSERSATEFRPRDLLANPPPETAETAEEPDEDRLEEGYEQKGRRIPVRLIGWGLFAAFFLTRTFFFGPDNLLELDPGTCYNEPTTEGDVIEKLDEVDCTEPHTFEVVGTYNSSILQTATIYPPDDVMNRESNERCGSLVGDYVGVPYGHSSIDYQFYFQAAEQWRDSRDAGVLCAAYTGQSFTASIKNRGSEYPLPCFDNDDLLLDCSVPHANEIFAFVFHPALRSVFYLGADELEVYANDRCGEEFLTYAGHAIEASDYVLGVFGPDEGSWELGDRYIGCFLLDSSGAELTGRVAG